MSIYIVSPYIKSGCIESLHQLSYHLNKEGFNSYIVYLDNKENGDVLYHDIYENLEMSTTIKENSIVILFELYKYTDIQRIFNLQACKYIVWWFSYINAISFDSIDTNLSDINVIHFFQGEYIKNMISSKLTEKHKWYYLHDYIHNEFINESGDKDNIIAYNPTKDFISAEFLIYNGYRTLPLVDLDRGYMKKLLANCKIYIDLGAHSGRDRIPREAALSGCVVITGDLGATKSENDIAIPEEFKVTSKEQAKEIINKVLDNYNYYYDLQHEYRDGLKEDKRRMIYQIRYIFGEQLFLNNAMNDHMLEKTNPITFIKEFDHLLTNPLCTEECPPILEETIRDVTSILVAGDEKVYHTLSLLKHKSLIVTRVDLNYSYIDALLEKLYKKYRHIPMYFIEYNNYTTYDCLLIDMLMYNYGTLYKVLTTWNQYITKYIIITNTELFGLKSNTYAEGESLRNLVNLTGFTEKELNIGLMECIYDFLEKNTRWCKVFDYKKGKGVVILQRKE